MQRTIKLGDASSAYQKSGLGYCSISLHGKQKGGGSGSDVLTLLDSHISTPASPPPMLTAKVCGFDHPLSTYNLNRSASILVNFSMTQLEEKILVQEIGKLAGFLGGFGARLVAKRLPVEEHEILTVLPANLNEVRAVAYKILESIGNTTDEFSSENTDDRISAIVGSGDMKLNPTIVHIVFLESTKISTNVSIKAIAKEGMVKQDSAAKAVQRIENLLTKSYAEQIIGREGETASL